MEDDTPRWALPALDAAVARCRSRNREEIRCILHVLGEDVTSEAGADRSLDASRACLQAIAAHDLDASVSLKLTALGALTDRARCRDRVAAFCEEAASLGVGCEFDMEGRNLVDFTLSVARSCAPPPAVALQAYLNRTAGDLGDAIDAGLGVRVVKGAYLGDTDDFFDIQDRFMALCAWCAARRVSFNIGTHDPDLVYRITDTMPGVRETAEFGFLMGLADETKVQMAREGFRVAEYIPFGGGIDAYVWRRERYLAALARLGRAALP
jgi:proline dehydrogenase